MTGGADAPARRVAGAHTIEIERPTTWLEPEWIMLTTGARLRRDPVAQRELIAELQASGATALGFGVGLVFKHVPAALADEAAIRDFPVFRVPLETAFRDIVSTINRALLSSDLRTLQRVSSMQLQLMDALAESDPRRAVVERLSAFLDASVLLFSPDGTLAAATGEAPAAGIFAEVTRRPATIVELEHDGWQTLATPVSGGAGPPGWLAVSTRRTLPSPRLARQAARATAPVLAALGRVDALARRQQRAIGAALLEDLLKPSGGRERSALAARAAALGIDFAVPARVVIVRGAAPERLTEHPQLVAARREETVVLAQAPHAELRAALTGSAVAGVGRPVSSVAGVPDSYRDAAVAARRAQLRGGGILDFADVDLVTLLVSEAPAERIRPKVDELLAPLRGHPGLRAALEAYFAHGLDAMAAARALHVHHNTLRYRLGRVEEALGRPLKDPATIALLYIALAAEGSEPSASAGR